MIIENRTSGASSGSSWRAPTLCVISTHVPHMQPSTSELSSSSVYSLLLTLPSLSLSLFNKPYPFLPPHPPRHIPLYIYRRSLRAPFSQCFSSHVYISWPRITEATPNRKRETNTSARNRCESAALRLVVVVFVLSFSLSLSSLGVPVLGRRLRRRQVFRAPLTGLIAPSLLLLSLSGQ